MSSCLAGDPNDPRLVEHRAFVDRLYGSATWRVTVLTTDDHTIDSEAVCSSAADVDGLVMSTLNSARAAGVVATWTVRRLG